MASLVAMVWASSVQFCSSLSRELKLRWLLASILRIQISGSGLLILCCLSSPSGVSWHSAIGHSAELAGANDITLGSRMRASLHNQRHLGRPQSITPHPERARRPLLYQNFVINIRQSQILLQSALHYIFEDFLALRYQPVLLPLLLFVIAGLHI